MRRTKGINGQMRIIEAILSSFVVLFATTFINTFAVTPLSPIYETGELEKVGHNVLHDLDEQRLLARFVYNQEWENLTAALMVSLPTDVYFNLTVYDLDGKIVNVELDYTYVPISYGDPEVFKTSSPIASVTYIIPGYSRYPDYSPDYNPRILILQLVRG